MIRFQVIEAILDRLEAKVYLEIGVQSGDPFFPLKARKKSRWIPQFLIMKRTELDWLRWNVWKAFNEYYPMTSDAFFKTPDKTLRARLVDVAFAGGLHTYEQSLADVQN